MDRRRFLRRALLRGALGAACGALTGRAVRRGGGPVLAGAVGGLAAGAALELPVTGVLGLPAAALAARAGGPGSVAAGMGATAALVSTRVWPVAPRTPAAIRPALTPVRGEPNEDGAGLTIIVNPSAGPSHREPPTEELRAGLPAATVVELGDDLDLDDALRQTGDARAIGIAGGDGSINAAAAVAHAAGKPLVVVPRGTLNHLARDLGLTGPDDAIAAVRDGHLVAVDLGTIDGQPFLNTASFGSYSDLVDGRERLEGRIGKWPAMLVALITVLRRATPMRVELDGHERALWMIFIGNCRYHPHGFAPTWRERLDDGLLDVRLVDAGHPWARVRLLLAVLTGRLGRTAVYEERTTDTIRVHSLDGPLRLARDGETFDGGRDVLVGKESEPLAIYVPEREP
jgi:diacylglycerol kinase family enzyme